MEKTYTPDEQIEQLNALIDRYHSKDKSRQIEDFENVLRSLKLLESANEPSHALPWLVARQKQFRRLPKGHQLPYMRHLVEWRAGAPREKSTEEATKEATKVSRRELELTMMLFPYISAFADCIRTGGYKESKDGNWFVWWTRKNLARPINSKANQGEVEEDRQLMRQAIFPTTIKGEHTKSPPIPSIAKKSPPESGKSATRPWDI
ncbi:hypothetical protein GGR53DRAFT_462413 [Hypoxylon sp. FL1150]|nr:hypothetical protein GGR53DRAFT_462413 [Hypoxylon sp. FL1150]